MSLELKSSIHEEAMIYIPFNLGLEPVTPTPEEVYKKLEAQYGTITIKLFTKHKELTCDNLNKIKAELDHSIAVLTNEIKTNPAATNSLLPEEQLVDCNMEMQPFVDYDMQLAKTKFATMAVDPKIQQIKQTVEIVKYIREASISNNIQHLNSQHISAQFPNASADTIARALQCILIRPDGNLIFKHPLDVQ